MTITIQRENSTPPTRYAHKKNIESLEIGGFPYAFDLSQVTDRKKMYRSILSTACKLNSNKSNNFVTQRKRTGESDHMLVWRLE